jgi:flagellar motility protein MotE (MotC chaperone)
MKPAVKYALFAAGGLVLLGGSFVVFAALSGTPLHEVAILEKFVAAPATGEHEAKSEPAAAHAEPSDEHAPDMDHGGSTASTKKPRMSAGDVRAVEANVGVLSAFMLPSPLSAGELSELQQSLRTTNNDAKKRLERITQRERELDEWEHSLDERTQELQELRRVIERKELDITLREDEVKRDENAKNARETQSWGELAKFFAEGDPEDLAKKLVLFEPKEAVRILRALDDERASALVNALPPDKYHAYLDAYRAAAPK